MATTDEPFSPVPAHSYREVAENEGKELATQAPAYTKYSQEMIALVGKTIMPKNYQPAELYFVLELAATYGLDPLIKEIWAVRMSENQNEPITVLVGVEGLLAIAERHPDFEGFGNQEVYANDTFKYGDVRPLKDGTYTHVKHEFSVTGDRGDLLGAWAEVYRAGRPPVFFWAPMDEYFRSSGRTPWNKQKTAMIRKVALSNALRRAFKLSGLYIPEEMGSGAMRNGARQDPAGAPTSDEMAATFWDDDEREARVTALFAALDACKPGGYLPGRRKVMLASAQTDEERDALMQALEIEIHEAGGIVPPLVPVETEVVEAEVAEAEGIPFGEAEDAEFIESVAAVPVQQDLPLDE